jgi:hypothetical protein
MRGVCTLIAAWAGLVQAGPARAERPLAEGLHRALLPLYRDLEGGGVGSMGIVGDSVSLLDASYNWQLRNLLEADFGSAGDGYLALARFDGSCGANGGGPRCGLQVIRGPGSYTADDTGPWETLGLPTPDGMWTELRPDFFPGSLTVRAYGREIVVHYTRRVGGGPMEIRLNGSPIATVETGLASGGPAWAGYTIDTGTDDPDALATIGLATSGDGPAQVNAVEMRGAGGGIRYHRLARGGAGPARYHASMTEANADLLRSLDLDLLIIMLDASDGDMDGGEWALYESNLATLADWYLAQLPQTRLVLMTHHPFTPSIGPQADAILSVTRSRGLGYINLFDLFSGYDEMNDLGYMHGSVHLSQLGGQWFGGYIHGLMDTAGREAVLADANADGEFNFFDVQAFLHAFSAGDADVNGDGVSDFFDVLAFLGAFNASMDD